MYDNRERVCLHDPPHGKQHQPQPRGTGGRHQRFHLPGHTDLLTEKRQLPLCLGDAFRHARIGTGVDNIIESLFADTVFRPDIASQDFTVRKPAACMLIVNPHNILHAESIAHSHYFLTTALDHITLLTFRKITKKHTQISIFMHLFTLCRGLFNASSFSCRSFVVS